MTHENRTTALHHAVHALVHALAYLRASGDPQLTGYAIALLRRCQGTIAPPDFQPRPDTAERWAIRQKIQSHGLESAIAALDAWEASPTATLADLNDLVREVYAVGIRTGIDSVLPEFADQCLSPS